MQTRSLKPKANQGTKPINLTEVEVMEQVRGLITMVQLRTAFLILRNEPACREEIPNFIVKALKEKWDDLVERSLVRFVERGVREMVARIRERRKQEAESMSSTQTNG